MSDYSIARDLLLFREGGFADVEGDKGGLTYCGITRMNYPTWPGWTFIIDRLKEGPIPNGAVFPQLNKAVSDFYRYEFWDALHLSQVEDQAIADQLLAIAVHYTRPKATMRIQKILNTKYGHSLKIDGVMGDKTIAAINSVKGFELNNSLFKATVTKYLESEQTQFIKGFVARALDCLVG
jgi:lysozyme family protein